MRTIFSTILLSMILLICGNIKVNAQEYEIVLNCPDTVGIDQQFKISYKVSANVDKFDTTPKTPFSVKGAEVLYGPHQGTRSSISLTAGTMTRSYSFEQTYVLSSSYSTQDITVEPMKFDVSQDNDVVAHLSTDRKVIKVITGYVSLKETDESEEAKKEGNSSEGDASFKSKKIKSADNIAADDVVFKWTTDKTDICLGDTVSCNCDLYTQLQPTQLSVISDKLPDDCIVLDDTLSDMTLETVEYEGRKCYHVKVQSFRIVPLRTGKISIGGNTFGLELLSGDAYDFFFGKPGYINYESTSNQACIKVKGKITQDNETLTSGKDCFLLCDISTSMTGNDIEPSRKSCVQEFANKWIKEFPQTGLISFAGRVEQYYAHIQEIGTVSFISEPKVDGTAIGDAMIAPISCGAKVKDLIIITDGANNRGYLSLNTAFNIISKYGIRVSYLYLNSGNDSIEYAIKGVDEQRRVKNIQMSDSELSTIMKLVQSTGGLFGKVHSTNELLSYVPKFKKLVESELPKSSKNYVFDDKVLGRFLNQYKEEILQNTVCKE